MKRIMSACLEQENRFDARSDYEAYLAKLERSYTKFKIVEEKSNPDGTIIVKIKKQYNSYDTGSYLD